MDPERVRSYLQVACAGLGFDIGEIWWTSNDSGISTLATIEEKKDERHLDGADDSSTGVADRKLRFVQLYTSKSYEDRRSQLVSPESEGASEKVSDVTAREPCSTSDLQKHALSPQLVDAIARSAQVVWANCEKKEGLLGRSDMRLQTAVGMPVAVDSKGNMCVVVMFSPENLESTDDAMEYLRFISRSATSSSIPCLLPVFDSNTMRPAIMPHAHDDTEGGHEHPPDPSFGEGVVAHYVSIEDGTGNDALVHSNHDLASAPKDCFGIPMLPSFAELGNSLREETTSPNPNCDPFDEASFGVWATIMERPEVDGGSQSSNIQQSMGAQSIAPANGGVGAVQYGGISSCEPLLDKPIMSIHRRERLEEFCSAFLEMSVFDVGDVWMPMGSSTVEDILGHVTSIVSNDKNALLNDFALVSQYAQIKLWSGAVGRAFASGNPVWSANYDVIVDSVRAAAFAKANIVTALAVPIFSSGSVSPACVLCCYSLVRAEAVPAVLRFVQQALRLLWTGLDEVEPHQSIGKDLWKDVAPADLGEMAADIEMHHAFLKKKRHHSSISMSPEKAYSGTSSAGVDGKLSAQMQAIELYGGESSGLPSPPETLLLQPGDEGSPFVTASVWKQQAMLATSPEAYYVIQNHLQDAVRSISDAVPYSPHQHLATNVNGTKRAHVVSSDMSYESNLSKAMRPQLQQPATNLQRSPVPAMQRPLQMPRPLINQFPPSGSTMMESPGITSLQMPSAKPGRMIHDVRTAPNVFVSGTFDSSEASQLPVNSIQVEQTPAGVPSYQTGFPPPATSMQFDSPFQTCLVMTSPSQIDEQKPDRVPSIALGPVHMPAPAGNTNQKLCRIDGCDEPAVSKRPHCENHSGNRHCEHPGCPKFAQGSTRFCIAHGGGRRCTFPGCDKGARDKHFCAAHGGGKRCCYEGCTKSAVGGSNLCTGHGGGRRCSIEGCEKSAQSSTPFCVKHGGGKKCAYDGCEKVARGRTLCCAAHGGGVRCKLEGCHRVAIGKQQLCRSHGGGSRSRSHGGRSRQSATPPPLLMGVAAHVQGV